MVASLIVAAPLNVFAPELVWNAPVEPLKLFDPDPDAVSPPETTGVAIVGLFEKTNTPPPPDPVSSLMTPASCELVVEAN